MEKLNFYINGASVPAKRDRVSTRSSLVTGDVVTKASAACPLDVAKAVDAASGAFGTWSVTMPAERRSMLLADADNLKARGDDIVAAMKNEMGTTEGWVWLNIMMASDMLVEAASLTTQIKGEIIPSNRPGSTAMAIRQPARGLLTMAPWNAPLSLAFGPSPLLWPTGIQWL